VIRAPHPGEEVTSTPPSAPIETGNPEIDKILNKQDGWKEFHVPPPKDRSVIRSPMDRVGELRTNPEINWDKVCHDLATQSIDDVGSDTGWIQQLDELIVKKHKVVLLRDKYGILYAAHFEIKPTVNADGSISYRYVLQKVYFKNPYW